MERVKEKQWSVFVTLGSICCSVCTSICMHGPVNPELSSMIGRLFCLWNLLLRYYFLATLIIFYFSIYYDCKLATAAISSVRCDDEPPRSAVVSSVRCDEEHLCLMYITGANSMILRCRIRKLNGKFMQCNSEPATDSRF